MHGLFYTAEWPRAPFVQSFFQILCISLVAVIYPATAQFPNDALEFFNQPVDVEEFIPYDSRNDLMDDDDPVEYDNFDPAEAAPEGNITCLGKSDLQLPVLDDWNPNLNTLQQICAKPQYGGLAPGKHLGGYCFETYGGLPVESTELGIVEFDVTRAADPAFGLINPRILFHCKNRCFCNSDTTNLRSKPKGYDVFSVGSWQSGNKRPPLAYEIKADVVDDFNEIRAAFHEGNSHVKRLKPDVPFASIPMLEEALRAEVWGRESFADPVMLDPQNRVECDGDYPSFGIPAPYTKDDFKSLQDMCATYLSGGNPGANAGAYCHRNDPLTSVMEGYQKASVWFSDELTPRVEWTWNNFFFSGSIRYHCRKYCKCANQKARKAKDVSDPAMLMWLNIGKGVIFELHDGSIKFSSVSTTATRSSSGSMDSSYTKHRPHGITTFTLLPPQANGPTSGPCGPDKNQFCNQVWPEAILGPVPRAPPPSNDPSYHDPLVICIAKAARKYQSTGSIPTQAWAFCHAKAAAAVKSAASLPIPNPLGPEFQTCKASCSSPGQCGAVASTISCSFQNTCVVDPSTRKETVLGSLAKTAVFYAAGVCLRQHSRPKLGGRSLFRAARFPDDDNETNTNTDMVVDETAWPCACNSTYVSHACCAAGVEGLVWEEAHLVLGQLEL